MKYQNTIEAVELMSGNIVELGISPLGSVVLDEDEKIVGFLSYDNLEYISRNDVAKVKEPEAWYSIKEYESEADFSEAEELDGEMVVNFADEYVDNSANIISKNNSYIVELDLQDMDAEAPRVEFFKKGDEEYMIESLSEYFAIERANGVDLEDEPIRYILK